MAYDSLKALIRQYIKTNGEQEITGQIMQNVLVEMVNQYPSTDGFATQSWVTSQGYATTSQLAGYLPLTGGTLSGNLSILNAYMSVVTADSSNTSYTTIIRGPGIEAQMMSSGTPIYRMVLDYGGLTFYDNDVAGTTITRSSITSGSFIKSGGTSAQFLKADGSVDSNTYVTSSVLSGYLPLTGGTLQGVLFFADENGQAVRGEIFGDEYGLNIQVAGQGKLLIENAIETDSTIKTEGFIKRGGTSAQFLKADGSVDSNTYLTSASLADYLPLTGGNISGNLTVNGTGYFSNTFTVQSIELGHGNEINSLTDGLYNLHLNYRVSGNVSICYGGGNCGIGTNNPSYKLDVNGSANATTLYENGTSLSNKYLALTGGTLTGYLFFSSNGINRGEIFGDEYGLNIQVSGQGKLLIENAIEADSTIKTAGFIKSDGTSSQFLKADGSVDSTTYLPKQGSSFYFITDADMPETAANIATLNAAHRMTLYRNAILMPYQMDNANDGGFIRSRGTSESSAIMEIGMWDDAGAGETIQFNYYPATSTINPTYSVTVPKKSGTIALTSDLASYNPTTNFKTINNQSIIGTGNINIEGGGGGVYDAEIEYLEATGTQWIDTGIIATDGSIQEYESMAFAYNNNAAIIVCGHNLQNDSSNGYNRNFMSLSRVNTVQVGKCADFGYYICSAAINEKHKFYLNTIGNNLIGKVDDQIFVNRTVSYTLTPNTTIKVFRLDYGPLITSGRIYNLKLWNSSNVLVRDFIPVRVGNVGYLYDKVSGELFGNAGTGSFVLGQDTGPGGGLPYLPLTGGTITGNLTINSGSSGTSLYIYGESSDGYGRIWMDGDGFNFECVRGSNLLYFNDGSYFSSFVDVNGRMGVGIDHTQTYQLTVNGQVGATGFVNTSDLRKKTITGDVPINLYNVANAPLFKFTWNGEKEYSGQHIGSAAQYWQTVLPELVIQGSDADMTLAMQYDVIALASAITVAKTVVNHEERIILLERENEALKKEIADLKSA